MPIYPYTMSAPGGGSSLPATFAGIAHETDHAAYGLAQMLEEYVPTPRIRGILDILLDGVTTIDGATGPSGVQSIEDLAWEMLTERFLHVVEGMGPAVGVNLDVIGRIVGQPRLDAFGGSDDIYRSALSLRIAVNRCAGKWSELLHLFELAGITEAVGAREWYPAAFRTEATDLTSAAWAAAVWLIMSDAKPGGVRWDWLWSDESETDIFIYSSQLATTETDVARGYGDLAFPPATGGHYMGLLT